MIDLNSIVEFFFVFVVALFGAIFNDFYNTMTNKDETVKVTRVILSAFTGAILMVASSNYLAKYVDDNVFMLLSFISGITGFKIFEKFRNVDLFDTCWKLINIAIEDKQKIKNDDNNNNTDDRYNKN